jgi:hypothetical protein
MIDAGAFLNNHVAMMTNVLFICARASGFCLCLIYRVFSAQAHPVNLFDSNTRFRRNL